MKPKTMILMIVAVGCGLGASIMTSRLLAERKDKDQGEATTPVLVAKAKVTGWTEIKDPGKMFEIKNYPVSLAPKGPIGELERVKGKKLNKNIAEGYALTEADVLNKEQASISDQLLPGQRATAIKINAQGLAGGFVLPGSRVDILLTSKRNGTATARTVLQHVLVMAIDNQDTRNPETKSILGQTVTVAATSAEASRLMLAASLGDLSLQVKGAGDQARISPVVVREEDLDKPLPSNQDKEEVAKADPISPTIPAIVLPPLPPEEKAEEPKVEPKPEPKVEVVQAEEKPAPKPKRHVMRIQTGASVEKAVFMLGERDPDEDEGGSGGSTTTTTTKPATAPKPPAKEPAIKLPPPPPGTKDPMKAKK